MQFRRHPASPTPSHFSVVTNTPSPEPNSRNQHRRHPVSGLFRHCTQNGRTGVSPFRAAPLRETVHILFVGCPEPLPQHGEGMRTTARTTRPVCLRPVFRETGLAESAPLQQPV